MSKIQVNPGSPITGGSNPWVDSVTYNAQWEQNNWSSPVKLKVNFLQPRNFNKISNLPIVQRNLSDSSYLGWNPKDPVDQFPLAVQESYLNAYQAWSNVALIGAKPIKKAERADVVFTLANYNNDGYLEGNSGPRVMGSHEGLLYDGRYGTEAKPALQPLISDANALAAAIDLEPNGNGVAPGSGFFETAIHEIGHGIGLSHPHDAGLGSVPSAVFPGLTPNDWFGEYGTGLYALNQVPYTIMSYIRGFRDGSTEQSRSHGLTPMALDVMAAQLKYGVNDSTSTEDNTYNLEDIMMLNAWKCIWDAGGIDTITGTTLPFPLTINLRPAEMNAMRPETGSPSERYDWGTANQWEEVLDTFLGLTATRAGFMLGSGITQSYNLGYYLDYIRTNNQTLWAETQNKLLDPLKEKLFQLRNNSFDYSDWSRAISTVAGGELRNLAQALSHLANTSTNKAERRTSTLAAEAAGLFQAIGNKLSGFTKDISNLDPNEQRFYYAGLAEARALQNEIMSRSAPGIAGHVSTFTPELYREYRNSGGFTIAAGVTIENAEGGSKNDEIIGNAADNRLYGNDGDDLIDGYLGNNLIDGGNGSDTAILFGNLDDYTFSGSEGNLIASNNHRGHESRLISIEVIRIGENTFTPGDLLRLTT